MLATELKAVMRNLKGRFRAMERALGHYLLVARMAKLNAGSGIWVCVNDVGNRAIIV